MLIFSKVGDDLDVKNKWLSIEVPMAQVSKVLEKEGIVVESVDEELFSIRYRHQLLTKALAKFLKNNI